MVVDGDGQLTGVRNDVQLAGLNHKLGYRAPPTVCSTLHERAGAVGYLVGQPGEGLAACST